MINLPDTNNVFLLVCWTHSGPSKVCHTLRSTLWWVCIIQRVTSSRFSYNHHHCSNTSLLWLQDIKDTGPEELHNLIYCETSEASPDLAVERW